ncbi:MAG: alkaline phosphatase family protein [Chloroflexi bacterium]|nr:alkaline phosphatase family protein [Chloroflexota bacterium]
MPNLVLGPLLRFLSEREASVWVETDAACEVEVLDQRVRTFHVEGHHYAILPLRGLEPGRRYEYAVRLDGDLVWPEAETSLPPSVIAPIDARVPLRIAFGSCRVSAPHTAPYSLTRLVDRRGRGLDALTAYTRRLLADPDQQRPQALLLLGDQVYADDVPAATRDYIAARRDIAQPPGSGIADFQEYACLYRESWLEPQVRWLLSTVSTSMMFDDHEVNDDWNISGSWIEEMRRLPWWNDRIVGAFMSYWIYQHLGNLSPDELDADPLLERVRAADDAGPLLRRFAYLADRESAGARWAFHRDLGRTRLVMLDGRAARVFGDGTREMVDAEEWAWVEESVAGDFDHLLLGTSVPYLLAPGMHHLQAWNEAVCDGAWGRRFSRIGEGIRRAIDLEHWAAFRTSFERFAALLRSVARGERGRAPASVILLSGDVHHAYLARVRFPPGTDATSRIYQAVCSPFRNSLGAGQRRAQRIGASRLGEVIGRALARSAGVPPPPFRWRAMEPLSFDNQIGTLEIHGRRAVIRLERAVAADDGEAVLEPVFERLLAREASPR